MTRKGTGSKVIQSVSFDEGLLSLLKVRAGVENRSLSNLICSLLSGVLVRDGGVTTKHEAQVVVTQSPEYPTAQSSVTDWVVREGVCQKCNGRKFVENYVGEWSPCPECGEKEAE